MPAIERPFDGSVLPPSRLYVDTDVLVAATVRTHPHYSRSSALFSLLIRYGLTTLYLCPVSWMEFAHVFGKETFRRALPPEFDHLDPIAGWEDVTVREAYFQFVMRTFNALLSPFEWNQVLLSDDVQTRAIGQMATHNLGAQDAVHLACAEIAGVRDLGSFDHRFRRVNGLYLWNDRIFISGMTASSARADRYSSSQSWKTGL